MTMTMTKLSDVQVQSEAPASPHVIGEYFKLITKILAGIIMFCWITTSNYLNSLHIDTDTMYPVFGTKEVRRKSETPSNPYATWVDPGPINMSNQPEVIDKIGLRWWLERTQQSCYQFGQLP